MPPHPGLVTWPRLHSLGSAGGKQVRALVVGCGVGDDAEELARLGMHVVAFDAARAAVESARRRFPASPVQYEVADLLAPPRSWGRAFDFVLEADTFQCLPLAALPAAMDRAASFVASGGTLLVLASGRDEHERVEGPPWPLAASDFERLEQTGLELVRFEDSMDELASAHRCFRIEYRRGQPAGS
jgi:SAM-dependent methyltransferase